MKDAFYNLFELFLIVRVVFKETNWFFFKKSHKTRKWTNKAIIVKNYSFVAIINLNSIINKFIWKKDPYTRKRIASASK